MNSQEYNEFYDSLDIAHGHWPENGHWPEKRQSYDQHIKDYKVWQQREFFAAWDKVIKL